MSASTMMVILTFCGQPSYGRYTAPEVAACRKAYIFCIKHEKSLESCAERVSSVMKWNN